MGRQSALVYSFVARGVVNLAEYTAIAGNFNVIAEKCLHKLDSATNKISMPYEKYLFNFLGDDGYTYCVVSEESLGTEIPMAFLERVKEDFKRRYGSGKSDTAAAHSLDKDYGPKLKEHMQYCADHPEEMSKLAKVKTQVSEVKGIMMENIEKVLDRGEKIELLVDKTENLRFQADNFQRQGRQLRRKMWLENMKVKLVVLGIVILLILIIWLSVCKGFKCH